MKRTGAFTLTVLVILISAYVLFDRRAADVDPNAPTASPPSPKPGGGPLLTLRNLVSPPIRKSSADPSRVSAECARLQEEMLALPIANLEYPPKIAHLPSPDGCSPSSPRIAKALQFYREKCQVAIRAMPTASTREEFNAGLGECQIAAIILRSTLAAESRAKEPLDEIEDMRELADLLVSEFGALFDKITPESMGRLIAIADRMLVLDPKMLPAAKAAAIGSILEAVASSKADWKDLEDRVRKIEDLDPNDPELDHFRRFVDTELMKPELVEKDSLSRISKNPDDWKEREILAWSEFKQGRRDQARTALRAALARAPNEPALRKDLAIVNDPRSKPDDFKVQLQLGVGFGDLLK
jgi:tetratricopeptide (TPR) repeat protein